MKALVAVVVLLVGVALPASAAGAGVPAQAERPVGMVTQTFVDTTRPTPRNVDRPKRATRVLGLGRLRAHDRRAPPSRLHR